jgi:hypothetical protein
VGVEGQGARKKVRGTRAESGEQGAGSEIKKTRDLKLETYRMNNERKDTGGRRRGKHPDFAGGDTGR